MPESSPAVFLWAPYRKPWQIQEISHQRDFLHPLTSWPPKKLQKVGAAGFSGHKSVLALVQKVVLQQVLHDSISDDGLQDGLKIK
jgi:hypothetical protein